MPPSRSPSECRTGLLSEPPPCASPIRRRCRRRPRPVSRAAALARTVEALHGLHATLEVLVARAAGGGTVRNAELEAALVELRDAVRAMRGAVGRDANG
jgi:hypothetical protein